MTVLCFGLLMCDVLKVQLIDVVMFLCSFVIQPPEDENFCRNICRVFDIRYICILSSEVFWLL